MKRLKALWQSLWADVDARVRGGRVLGLTFIAGGFVAMAKAWDGAAGQNFVPSQMPYLLSGGFVGLGLVVTGVMLVLLSTVRAERKVLVSKLDQMVTLLSRNLARQQASTNGAAVGSLQQVAAAGSMYHSPGCKVLDGKTGVVMLGAEQAAAEGLTPCRVCDAPRPKPEPAATAAS